MVRLKTWTGSAWADTRVWDGSQWRAFVPPVYGAGYWREDFNAAGLAGFTGSGGDSGVFPVSNWANVHLYVDTTSAWLYAPAGIMERVGTYEAPLMAYVVKPGQDVYIQGSFYCPLVAGARPVGTGYIDLYATFSCPEIGSTGTQVTGGITMTQDDWGWGLIQSTTPYTIPATPGNEFTPRTLRLNSVQARHVHSHDGMGETPGQYRLYWDWVRVIDGAGNELLRQTSPPVEPLRVWTGTAWV